MDIKADPSDGAQGLRLIRAFLSLPPDKRTEVIALVEDLVRAHGRADDSQKTAPRRDR